MAGQIKRTIRFNCRTTGQRQPDYRPHHQGETGSEGRQSRLIRRTSPDDPVIMAKIRKIAVDFGVQLGSDEWPVTTAFSTKPVPDAVHDLRAQCGNSKPRAVIFFASPQYDLPALNREISQAFPEACIVGCSTAGEIVGGAMLSGSVVAMFLGEGVVEHAAAAVVEDISSGTCVRDALLKLERDFQAPLSTLDLRSTWAWCCWMA